MPYRWEPTANDLLKIEEGSRHGLNIDQICACVGISRQTYYDRINDGSHPELSEAYRRGKARGTEAVAGKLMELCMAGNFKAIQFYLRCQAGWSDRQRISIPDPMQVFDEAGTITEEQLEGMARAYLASRRSAMAIEAEAKKLAGPMDSGRSGNSSAFLKAVLLYHTTTEQAARAILSGGFKDATGNFLTDREFAGVWLSDRPLDENDGTKGGTVLQVSLSAPESAIAEFEWSEEGKPYREWLIPAVRLKPLIAGVRIVSPK